MADLGYKETDPNRHKDWEQYHCNYQTLGMVKDGLWQGAPIDLHTTFRDPYHVAASWWNRGKNNADRWFEQWDVWHQIKGKATVHRIEDLKNTQGRHDDKLWLHAAVDNGDLDYFYSVVPKEWIEAAID